DGAIRARGTAMLAMLAQQWHPAGGSGTVPSRNRSSLGIAVTDRPEIIAEQVALVERQLRANRSTQHQWDTFESHREALTSRIVDSAPRGTLCLLGAGNCNDVDLERLARHFDAIHLV